MGNVQYTADAIGKLLTLPEDWEFNYSSSWWFFKKFTRWVALLLLSVYTYTYTYYERTQ
jgi:hypothetical protein